jgi:hypothetical protein
MYPTHAAVNTSIHARVVVIRVAGKHNLPRA